MSSNRHLLLKSNKPNYRFVTLFHSSSILNTESDSHKIYIQTIENNETKDTPESNGFKYFKELAESKYFENFQQSKKINTQEYQEFMRLISSEKFQLLKEIMTLENEQFNQLKKIISFEEFHLFTKFVFENPEENGEYESPNHAEKYEEFKKLVSSKESQILKKIAVLDSEEFGELKQFIFSKKFLLYREILVGEKKDVANMLDNIHIKTAEREMKMAYPPQGIWAMKLQVMQRLRVYNDDSILQGAINDYLDYCKKNQSENDDLTELLLTSSDIDTHAHFASRKIIEDELLATSLSNDERIQRIDEILSSFVVQLEKEVKPEFLTKKEQDEAFFKLLETSEKISYMPEQMNNGQLYHVIHRWFTHYKNLERNAKEGLRWNNQYRTVLLKNNQEGKPHPLFDSLMERLDIDDKQYHLNIQEAKKFKLNPRIPDSALSRSNAKFTLHSRENDYYSLLGLSREEFVSLTKKKRLFDDDRQVSDEFTFTQGDMNESEDKPLHKNLASPKKLKKIMETGDTSKKGMKNTFFKLLYQSLQSEISNRKTKSNAFGGVNSGDEELNDMNSGDEELSDVNSGDEELSDVNSGDEELSDVNSGDEELSDVNSGDEELSDVNSGDEELSDVSSGDEKLSDLISESNLTDSSSSDDDDVDDDDDDENTQKFEDKFNNFFNENEAKMKESKKYKEEEGDNSETNPAKWRFELKGDWSILHLGNRYYQTVTTNGIKGSYQTLVAVGNGRGLAGFAFGKASSPASAEEQAILRARRNLLYVDRFRGCTLLHNVSGKFRKTKVEIYSNRLIKGSVNSIVEKVMALFGISGYGAKVAGNKDSYAILTALFKALSLHQSMSAIVLGRGKRITSLERAKKLGL